MEGIMAMSRVLWPRSRDRREEKRVCTRMQMYAYARIPVSKYRENKPEYAPLSFRNDTFK